ncbi:MAG: hypothetical protein WD969_07320 [Paracoccaceae bacterium]
MRLTITSEVIDRRRRRTHVSDGFNGMETGIMFVITATRLRQALWLDAASCAFMGAGLLAFTGPLAALTALPAILLTAAGAALAPIAAVIALTAARGTLSQFLVAVIVWGNAGWVAVSLALLGGLAPMNAYGVALVLLQALAVAALTCVEAAGLKRFVAAKEA